MGVRGDAPQDRRDLSSAGVVAPWTHVALAASMRNRIWSNRVEHHGPASPPASVGPHRIAARNRPRGRPQTRLSAAHRGRRLQAGPGLAFPKHSRGLARVARPSRTGKDAVLRGIGDRISGGAHCAIGAAIDWLGSHLADLTAVAVTDRSLRERPERRNRHGKRFLERR